MTEAGIGSPGYLGLVRSVTWYCPFRTNMFWVDMITDGQSKRQAQCQTNPKQTWRRNAYTYEGANDGVLVVCDETV